MPTAIKLWEVARDTLEPVPDANFADSHLEADLEGWIAANPDILGDRMLIIDRQRDIAGVGRLDLLAIDQNGKLVIIELKRDRTPREAVAQALDYASWLDGATAEQIEGHAEAFLGRPLAEAFFEYFQTDMPELSCQQHRIALIAPRLDASSERIIKYLSDRYGVDINAIFFHCARLNDGREILARTILVPEEVRATGPTRKRRPTVDELLAAANDRGTRTLVNICRGIRDKWDEEAWHTYGGSFRYWATGSSGQSRMVFGVNVAGKNEPPRGELDVWVPVRSLAEVTGISEEQLRKQLGEQPVLEMHTVDCWLRIRSDEEAARLADYLREIGNPRTVLAG